MSKIKIIIVILFIVTGYAGLFSAEADTARDYKNNFDSILSDLDDLVYKTFERNSLIADRYLFIRNRMNKHELGISFIDSDKTVFGGMEFAFTEDKNVVPFIGISKKIISLYGRSPSLVFSELIHEFDHAYNYFTYRERFVSTFNNVVEQYLYEMDASYIEAQFIRDMVIPSGLTITKFEDFLLKSLNNDNLKTASVIFLSVDMDLVYELSRLVYKDISREKKIEQIEETAKNLVIEFDKQILDSDSAIYMAIIPLYSFTKYSPQILFNTEKTHNKEFDIMSFSIKNYIGINEQISVMNEKIDKYKEAFNRYKNSTIENFNEL